MRATFLVALVLVLALNLAEARSPWPVPLPVRPPKSESTLKLVHVLFRHGNRNPEKSSVWDGNPFQNESYYPEGWGQLTNAGKLREYNLGKYLRSRYDSFLGDYWNIDYVDFRTTNYNRTKMSGLLVMAGLWPPRGSNVWNPDLDWQPIPYNYYQAEDDLVLGSSCSLISEAIAEVYNSPEIQNYLQERYGETMEIISQNTGIDVDDFSTGIGYFDAMKVQDDLGFPFDEWVNQVYPEPLNSAAVDMYRIRTNTTTLRRLSVGNLIQKILDDSENFKNGTLTPSSRKLFVYSAHDMNVGAVILSLEAYTMKQTPPYGSTVIFEVHEISGVWGLKLFYVDYNEGSPHPLSIPGCEHFCPIEQFTSLVSEILPIPNEC